MFDIVAVIEGVKVDVGVNDSGKVADTVGSTVNVGD